MPSSSNKSATPFLTRLLILVSLLLVLAGLTAFWWASKTAGEKATNTATDAIQITIGDGTCTPNDIEVPAGRTTFSISNQSKRVLEWEILDGVMVIEERENIAPGFVQTMTAKLQPGTYAITCGLLSNPRGTLRVTPSSTSIAEAAQPPVLEYVGALAEYRVYLTLQAMQAQEAITQLTEAIQQGDADKAQQAYLAAHQAYGHVKPMASLFSDLDTQIDVRPEYLEKREADPGFVGFNQIGGTLYSQSDLQGLTPAVTALADQLKDLNQRVRALDIPPRQLAAASMHSLQRLAGQLNEQWPLPAQAELDYVYSLVQGNQIVIQRLTPLLSKAKPDLLERINNDYSALLQALEPYLGDTHASEPDSAQRKTLAELVEAVATNVEQINPALGLD